MSRIAIITDTDSSIPLELSQEFNINQVPITIQFGENSYRDMYDIDNPTVFSWIDKEGKLPTTAAPSPGQFVDAFKNAFSAGAETILCFCISSEMSGTFNSANTAAEMFPGKDISIVDTRTLSIAQGFMVLAAAEFIAAGKSKEEAIFAAKDVNERTHLFAALSTLKYLAMGGRVSHLAAAFAGMLEVKPVLSVIDGKLQLLERVRTQTKAWAHVVELATQAGTGKQIERIGYLHISAPEMARALADQVAKVLPCDKEPLFWEMTPGLSIHSGAGLAGVCFVTK